jgi:hypothetical protein
VANASMNKKLDLKTNWNVEKKVEFFSIFIFI